MKIIEMNVAHCDVFCSLRLQLFKELSEIDAKANISALEMASKEYYDSHIGKDLLCWGIASGDEIVATASLCLFSRMPYAGNLAGKEGYILNVYTVPLFRRRGMSKSLVDTIVEYAKKNGIARLWLNSSEQGKSIYQECGFVENDTEMELTVF